MSNKVILAVITPIIPLGFYRGVKEYRWTTTKYNQEYLYSSAFGYGLAGTVIYLCPLLTVNNIAKELYRAEANLRNMDNLKKTDYYNNLI
jgi:hypothetical protein